MSVRILTGDVREIVSSLPDDAFQCCVTSPPYWKLRDYGDPRQLGLEPTPEEYVSNLVSVFRELWPKLRDDATLWLNLGDSYAGSGQSSRVSSKSTLRDGTQWKPGGPIHETRELGRAPTPKGLKPKDLIGIPWMVAFALRADGWYLRADNIWNKTNAMPGSQEDRSTIAHEYIFHLSKSETYYYDHVAVREDTASEVGRLSGNAERKHRVDFGGNPLLANAHQGFAVPWENEGFGRTKRSVWPMATVPLGETHYAAFPPELAETCIAAGSSDKACEHCGAPWERIVEKQSVDRTELPKSHPEYRPRQYASKYDNLPDHVMGGSRGRYAKMMTKGWQPTCTCKNEGLSRSHIIDPFGGAGTTGLVADRMNRDATLIELVPASVQIAEGRIVGDAPLFADVRLD